MDKTNINDFENIRLINQDHIFEYIPMGHPHRPSSPAILFVKKGNITLKEHITKFHLQENSIVFIDNNNVYEVLETANDPEIILLGFKRQFLESISIRLNKVQVYQSLKRQLKRNFTLPQEQMNILMDSLLKIEFYHQQKDKLNYVNDIVEHYFIIILFHIASIVESSNNEHYQVLNRNQRLLNDFIFLVSENYLIHKNVTYYSQKLGITTRYMSAVIKKESGKTPQEYITEFIVNEAKAQLSSTTKDIKQIALDLKFSDQYSFSHFFKKHENISPSAYRKTILK